MEDNMKRKRTQFGKKKNSKISFFLQKRVDWYTFKQDAKILANLVLFGDPIFPWQSGL